ncbi:hypothetical protein TCE0_022f06920 [Talaromyces pinophilus]|uniref:Uncharacterized protein n=1 Tax=Talaromyces pinophilus TaxID=128442 RepID=A0A6V8H7S8_TALPI|nr:hypothetical protein TCE0_022f06920 [Talaromyces pinophilus]
MKNIPAILFISTSLFIHVNARLYNENARLLPWTPHKTSQVGQSIIYNGIGYLADRDHALIHVIDLNNHHQKTIKGLNGKSLKEGQQYQHDKNFDFYCYCYYYWSECVFELANGPCSITHLRSESDWQQPGLMVLLPERNELYVAEANSTVRVINLKHKKKWKVEKISTGLQIRLRIQAIRPLFPSLSDFATYHSVMDRFYVAIRATEANPGGEINEIDHRTLKTTNVISLAGCHPTGVAFGPDQNLYVGCGRGQIPTYGYGYSVVLDMVSNGSIVGNISGMSGLGQVIYEPSLNLYYAAAYRDLAITPGELSPGQERYSPSPRVTIINASDNTVIQSIQTENITSQTVAVDPKTKQMVYEECEGVVGFSCDGDGDVCFISVSGGVVV